MSEGEKIAGGGPRRGRIQISLCFENSDRLVPMCELLNELNQSGDDFMVANRIDCKCQAKSAWMTLGQLGLTFGVEEGNG